MPQFLWRETRIADLREALHRYRDHDHGTRQKAAADLMRLWEAEIAEHQAWLQARNPTREPSDSSEPSEPSEPSVPSKPSKPSKPTAPSAPSEPTRRRSRT
jgi:hypothetical protein